MCSSDLPAGLAGKTLQPIEGLHQAAAVDPDWQQLIQQVAQRCRTTTFRTLKAALPPGWLGQRRERSAGSPRRQLWLELSASGQTHNPEELTERQAMVLQLLREQGGQGWMQPLLERSGVSRSVVEALEKQGLLQRSLRVLDPALSSGPLEPPRALTADQAQALEAIRQAAAGSSLLLWGVTGAGKTEVYLQAAADELAAGRSVLLLTPEIGLIPQLLDRCRQRFGAAVLEYHSGCSDGQRIASWRRCLAAAEGGLVVVGTRSAVFLPVPRLGLIVLDEEHDRSYKQDAPMPCYHARDVAELRVRSSGGRLLLGSATPSLESWLACQAQPPRCQLLQLPQRIGGRPLPPVYLVDMRQELAEGHRRLISRPLMERLERLQSRGEQAVVLVPRRGYSTFLSCRSCGEVVECPHCDVAMTVHRQQQRSWLRCH